MSVLFKFSLKYYFSNLLNNTTISSKFPMFHKEKIPLVLLVNWNEIWIVLRHKFVCRCADSCGISWQPLLHSDFFRLIWKRFVHIVKTNEFMRGTTLFCLRKDCFCGFIDHVWFYISSDFFQDDSGVLEWKV